VINDLPARLNEVANTLDNMGKRDAANTVREGIESLRCLRDVAEAARLNLPSMKRWREKKLTQGDKSNLRVLSMCIQLALRTTR
jgi:hypothetical protein